MHGLITNLKKNVLKKAVNGLNPEVTVDKVFWLSEWEWSSKGSM